VSDIHVTIERQSQDLEEKHRSATRDFRELLKVPQEARLTKIRRSLDRFRGVTLARMLLDEARKNIPAQPLAAQKLAETANAVLLRTPETPGINDLMARAAALRGSALRAMGQFPEAEKRIRGARSIIRQRGVADPFVSAEVDWIEGMLRKDQRRFDKAENLLTRAAALFLAFSPGKMEEAEPSFLDAWKGFVGESVGYDAARVSLDLALLYAEQGKTLELRQLAAEIQTIFSEEDVHREAIAALAFFEKAVRQDQATVEVIEDLSAFLERARSNPTLRFRQQ